MQSILLAYGEGGHETQMRRLLSQLTGLASADIKKLAFIEGEAKEIQGIELTHRCRPLRDKHHRFSFTSAASIFWKNASTLRRLIKKKNVKVILTTGPGIAIIAAIVGRLSGTRVIHIETWSRFYSKSFTGKFMYWLADHFYVQNKELLSLYPKATWCGRL